MKNSFTGSSVARVKTKPLEPPHAAGHMTRIEPPHAAGHMTGIVIFVNIG